MAMLALMKSENIPVACKSLSEASCRISTEDHKDLLELQEAI